MAEDKKENENKESGKPDPSSGPEKPKEKTANVIQKGANQPRRVVIEVKDLSITIVENDLQPLELAEVCRRILAKVGG